MAKKYFTFVDRFLPVQFFEEDPVTITLTISDQMAAKIDAGIKQLGTTTTPEKCRDILVAWVGEENTEKLLSRCEDVDTYTISQLLLYIKQSYMEGQRKNLVAAAAGRQRK